MQRVAIARALANRPALLLADEPTGELDDRTSEHIADLFERVNADGTAILVVTHNPALAARAARRLAMASGRMVAMILRLALRSLAMRPMRTAVLAIGFGLGIAVMAELVGVGEVILEQAHSPALAGGGDLVVSGAYGSLESARFVLAHVLGSDRLRARVRAASPFRKATLYLMQKDGPIPVTVRGGVPDREHAIGDPEVADATRNGATHRATTRGPRRRRASCCGRWIVFIPCRLAAPARVSVAASWAEWLYFNGRSADGSLRFYLTFLSRGSRARSAQRPRDRAPAAESARRDDELHRSGGGRRRARCWRARRTSTRAAAACASHAGRHLPHHARPAAAPAERPGR